MSTLAQEFAIPSLLITITSFFIVSAILISLDLRQTDISPSEKITIAILMWIPISILSSMTLLGFILPFLPEPNNSSSSLYN